jgi:predicted phage terminase large subunit-like protein
MSNPGSRIAVIAPTYADARDTCIEGESGLRSVIPASNIQAWNRSLGELILHNGTRYKLFGAEEPERLRGPQHHRAWCDELGAWRYPETWDQMLFGLRLGTHPRVVVTTTPKPNPLIRSIMENSRTVISTGSTFDNAANLAPEALRQLREKYEGTRLGRQELYAELLDDTPGALWTRAMIDEARCAGIPDLTRVVVAIDPSGTKGSSDDGDSIGIVVAGKGVDGKAYVLADRTCKLSPDGWGRRAVNAFNEYEADRIVAERNFGGAMVEHVIKTVDPKVPYKELTASRGKVIRAEPVAALYEQGRVKHVAGLNALEDQMCMMTGEGFVGDGSPDRVDALVWALTELMLGYHQPSSLSQSYSTSR